jgi:large subunit ribosomal protein L21
VTIFHFVTFSSFLFEKVLLTIDGAITVGAPAVEGVSVQAEILDHVQADKVIVFKKKRRKGYKVKNGHRQQLTQIQIVSIGGADAPKAKKATKKETTEEVVAEEKPAEKPAAKKTAKKDTED